VRKALQTLIYKGHYYNTVAAYQSLKDSVEKMGYEIAGNIYQDDLIDYFAEQDPNNYLFRISLQIKKGTNEKPA